MKWAWTALVILLAVLLVAGDVANAAPGNNKRCKHKLQRKAWHKLSKREKLSYLEAEKCLMTLPAKMGFQGTRTRFDELQAVHAMAGEQIHVNGQFLPYHRWIMHAHEQMLRKECGYKGAQPYWDEKHDAGKLEKSIIHDPVYGFGGNGAPPQGCIQDGPFVGYINGIGPGREINDRCISRLHNPEASWWMHQAFVNYCYQTFKDYSTVWFCLQNAPHAGGHAAIGGVMSDPYASPGDPIFYLHHTFLDKVWWNWQAIDLKSRLYDMGGTNQGDPCMVFTPEDGFPSLPPIPAWPGGKFSFKRFANFSIPFPGVPGGVPPVVGCENGTNVQPPFPTPGDPGNMVTLGHVMSMYGLLPNITIREIMDIGNSMLCYEYV